ncbi:MAG: TIGR03118 family protein [Betaproteobacteria bacterium]|nr:MAG: TIGR03118 family protein [Betaproteobacteria bacterium]
MAGQSHGIVDTFDLAGNMLARFAQHGQLDSPWGVAQAPAGFGQFRGQILIGNFGNGHINAFDPGSGEFLDKVRNPHGQAIVIDGLWTIMFGNGRNGGDQNKLYFTAGPNDESDGLFGSLAPAE